MHDSQKPQLYKSSTLEAKLIAIILCMIFEKLTSGVDYAYFTWFCILIAYIEHPLLDDFLRYPMNLFSSNRYHILCFICNLSIQIMFKWNEKVDILVLCQHFESFWMCDLK